MPLSPGVRLGPYDIVAALGAGGMGEVYRARDTRLDRTVAIKILPEILAADALFRERFAREAKAISQLAHPHICTLHDVGRASVGAGGTEVDFIVMEYLEGETLALRLARGTFAIDEALRIAMEIASALEHAHRRDIVHRDLKPANVMLTRTGVKLLDFGLAKFRPLAGIGAGSAAALTQLHTAEGTLIGTLPYMAPEQLQGTEADARADIWALGCVLYEMIARRRAFDAEHPATLIAAILERHPPPLLERQPLTPPLVDHIIRTCLAKDPEDRWQSAADVKRELGWIRDGARLTGSSGGVTRSRRKLFAAAALVLGASVAISWLALSRLRGRPEAAPSARLSISLSESGLTLVPSGLAISPDGQAVVFVAKGDGEQRLYLRRLNESAVRALTGSERGIAPFFSPDADWVGFAVVNRGIFKMPVAGGPVERVYAASSGPMFGATWERSGRIVFGTGAGTPAAGLWSVPANGGTLTALARATDISAVAYGAPHLLPGGESVLFTIRKGGEASIGALVLRTGDVRTIIESGTRPWYSPTGHLLYASGGHLRAVPFDVDRLQTRGASRVVVESVADDQTGIAIYAISATGTLAYMPAPGALKRLVWVDRAGAKIPLGFEPRRYSLPELSPDGRLVAVTVQDDATRNVWVGDIDSGALTKLTFGNDDVYSTFTADSKAVLFTSGQNGRYNVFSATADGVGTAQRVTSSSHPQRVTSISPDGKTLLLNDIDQATGVDVLQMTVGNPESISPFVSTRFVEVGAKFSPDGRWVAYSSDESGRPEVYVKAFPGPGIKRQVSVGGGQSPVWNPRGDELAYQGPTDVMSVAISNGSAVRPPVKLFAHAPTTGMARDWTISTDGLRFLVVDDVDARRGSQINVVLNLLEEVRARVPAAK